MSVPSEGEREPHGYLEPGPSRRTHREAGLCEWCGHTNCPHLGWVGSRTVACLWSGEALDLCVWMAVSNGVVDELSWSVVLEAREVLVGVCSVANVEV